VVRSAETAAAQVAGVRHVHVRARTTGRVLRLEVEGWIDGATSVEEADEIGQCVAEALTDAVPAMRSFTWTTRAI
jgi:divalent metal cation (Fe/Co/Zn/Cd) transporter